MSKRARSILQGLIVLAILFFWGMAIAQNWQEFITYPWAFSWPYFVLALVAASLEIVVALTIWWRALALTGVRIPWFLGMELFFQAQIARYLPGGVWDLVGRFVLGGQAGVGKRAMAASMGLEMGLQVLSGSLFLLAALMLRAQFAVQTYLLLGVVVFLGALVFLSPPLFSFFVNRGLKLLKKPPLELTLTYQDLFLLFLLRVAGHGLMGLGFYFTVQGLTSVTLADGPLLITAFVGAWLIGYLAVVFPMGVGVREGALVLLSSGVLPFSVATAAVVGYRVIIALRDLLAAGIGVILARRS